MNLDVYTQHVPLTQKARFWGNFVSALKGAKYANIYANFHAKYHSCLLIVECVAGGKDLYAAPEPHVRNFYPSIVEYIPTADSKTKNEFGRLEARTPSDISISILLICILWPANIEQL